MKIKFLKDGFGRKMNEEIEATESEVKAYGNYVEEVKADASAVIEKAASEIADRIDEQDKKIADLAKKFAKGVNRPAINVGKDGVEEDPQRGFKSPGHFYMAVKNKDEAVLKAAGLTGGASADGGYALPPAFSTVLLNQVNTGVDSLVGQTFNVDLSGDGRMMTFPVIKNYDLTSTDPTKVAVFNWLAEAASKPTSKPQFESKSLTLKKGAVVLPATDEMLSDFGALASILNGLGVTAIKRNVNEAIVRGNGSTQPTGILGHAATVNVTRSLATFDEYQGETGGIVTDIYTMRSRFWGNYSSAVWIYNQDILPELAQARIGNIPVYLPAGGLSATPFDTILGRPAIASENASAGGSSGDLILADLKQYVTLTKGGVDIQQSIHVYFLTDETAFRFVYRIDGMPALTSPVTPLHGGHTLSPFVVRN